MLLVVVCSQGYYTCLSALQTCHSWRSAHDGTLRRLVPSHFIYAEGLQRLPALFAALTHLAFMERSRDECELVGHDVFRLTCCLVLPSPLTAQTASHVKPCSLQAELYKVVEQLPLRSLDIQVINFKELRRQFSDGSAVRRMTVNLSVSAALCPDSCVAVVMKNSLRTMTITFTCVGAFQQASDSCFGGLAHSNRPFRSA